MDIGSLVKTALSISDPEITMDMFVGVLCMLNPGDKFKDDLGIWFVTHARPHFMTDLLMSSPDKIAKTRVIDYIDISEVASHAPTIQVPFLMGKGGQA